MIEHLDAQKRRYERGDHVKHRQRPEWGVGTVTKAEDIASTKAHSQRLTVRFPNTGLKTLNTSVADIEFVQDKSAATSGGAVNGHSQRRTRSEIVHGTAKSEPEQHWLAPVNEQKREQLLQAIPESASDPFSSIRRRLQATLDLYRFDRSGKGLIDWAVAQTGIDDPLSTWTRHELEEKFDRWSAARDDHLRTVLRDDECTAEIVRELLAGAPAAAKQAVQRNTSRR